MLQVEDEREAVPGVVFRSQVALLARTLRPRPLSRVVDPADDVIIVSLLAEA